MGRTDGTVTPLMRPLQALSIYNGSNFREHLNPCVLNSSKSKIFPT